MKENEQEFSFEKFLEEMLNLGDDYSITLIEKDDEDETITINIKYNKDFYEESGEPMRLYDLAPERTWQHLGWFQYRCYIICQLPRYVDKENKVKTVQPTFADPMKGYTLLFARCIILGLLKIRVQKTTADLFKTTSYIVRTIMEEAVERGLANRGIVSDLVNVSLDEKAFLDGHQYATILIDSD